MAAIATPSPLALAVSPSASPTPAPVSVVAPDLAAELASHLVSMESRLRSPRTPFTQFNWLGQNQQAAYYQLMAHPGWLPTYLSQGRLSPYDDPLPESEEVLLGGSQGGHVREIAAGHPTSNQPGPLPITHEEPRRCGQGSGSPPSQIPAGHVEAAHAARPRPPNRSVEAKERFLLDRAHDFAPQPGGSVISGAGADVGRGRPAVLLGDGSTQSPTASSLLGGPRASELAWERYHARRQLPHGELEQRGGGKVSSGAGMTPRLTKASISSSGEGRGPRHYSLLAPWLQSGIAAAYKLNRPTV